MRRLLRSLEKKLVRERTEIAVVPLVHDLLSRWEDALSQDRAAPDVLDFVARLIRSGYCLTTGTRAFTYLDECRRTSSLPDERRLLRILMPWYVPDTPSASIASVTPDFADLIAKKGSQRPDQGTGFPKIPGVER